MKCDMYCMLVVGGRPSGRWSGFQWTHTSKKTFENKLDFHWIINQTLISSIVLIQESDGHQCLWLDSRDPDSSPHDQVLTVLILKIISQ